MHKQDGDASTNVMCVCVESYDSFYYAIISISVLRNRWKVCVSSFHFEIFFNPDVTGSGVIPGDLEIQTVTSRSVTLPTFGYLWFCPSEPEDDRMCGFRIVVFRLQSCCFQAARFPCYGRHRDLRCMLPPSISCHGRQWDVWCVGGVRWSCCFHAARFPYHGRYRVFRCMLPPSISCHGRQRDVWCVGGIDQWDRTSASRWFRTNRRKVSLRILARTQWRLDPPSLIQPFIQVNRE